MTKTEPKRCKDCGPTPNHAHRPAPYPGPRCYTHHRAFKRKQRIEAHDKSVVKTYGLQPGEYERIYQEQNGVCRICGWAKGRARRLAVDHDHDTGRVRGLLCSVCNQFVGYVRNDPVAFMRGYYYLGGNE